jgi:hypothetical protein
MYVVVIRFKAFAFSSASFALSLALADNKKAKLMRSGKEFFQRVHVVVTERDDDDGALHDL